MRRSADEYLNDIVSWGQDVADHIDGLSRETFRGDTMAQHAVAYAVQVVGEAAKQLGARWPEAAATLEPDIGGAIATRDFLAHGYLRIDPDVLWDTATISVPEFAEHVRKHIEATATGRGTSA